MISTLLLFALISPPAASPPSGYSLVAATDDRFTRDLHEKKIDDVLGLYTADAVFVNPDGTQATGPGLRKLDQQVTAAFDSDLHMTPVTLKRHGKAAAEAGKYTETLGHRDTGKIDRIQGTYRFSFRQESDGRWRYTRMEWH